MRKMFSETILINHGASVVQNGFHNGEVHEERSETSASASCYDGRQKSGAFYQSHVVEKMYSLVGNGVTNGTHHSDLVGEVNGDVGEEGEDIVEEVSCFVRSEIKWVFLKNVKVYFYGTRPIMTLQNLRQRTEVYSLISF